MTKTILTRTSSPRAAGAPNARPDCIKKF